MALWFNKIYINGVDINMDNPTFIEKVKALISPERVALATGLVVSATAFLASIQTSLVPGSPPAEAVAKAIVALGAVAGAIKLIDKFLDGAQQWNVLVADPNSAVNIVGSETDLLTLPDHPDNPDMPNWQIEERDLEDFSPPVETDYVRYADPAAERLELEGPKP